MTHIYASFYSPKFWNRHNEDYLWSCSLHTKMADCKGYLQKHYHGEFLELINYNRVLSRDVRNGGHVGIPN